MTAFPDYHRDSPFGTIPRGVPPMSDIAAVPVATSNTAQLTAWDGTEGQYWASHADDYDAAMAGYHQSLLELAAIRRNDTVLDIGCGTGQTTRGAARLASSGSALGVDL